MRLCHLKSQVPLPRCQKAKFPVSGKTVSQDMVSSRLADLHFLNKIAARNV
jgi:hypothetical protein